MRCSECGIESEHLQIRYDRISFALGNKTAKMFRFCDDCVTLYDAVARPHFINAQIEYLRENAQLAKRKRQLLGGDDAHA